ncbi:hypothetical protein RV134_310330 [Roseovarius sp. EC-HK134]|nr:hypothetical protein RV420_360436 [Roseovarius sp. EC-SD190]VVT21347.1 hypothetical protein RV134_310330 [Roseovarius sp. EC-HK134]
MLRSTSDSTNILEVNVDSETSVPTLPNRHVCFEVRLVSLMGDATMTLPAYSSSPSRRSTGVLINGRENPLARVWL